MATVFPAMRGVYQRQVGQWKWLTWPSNKQTMCIYKFYHYFYSHLFTHTSTHSPQFTGWPGVLQLYCGVGIYGGFFDWFHWQFPHNCLYECEIKRKTLLAKNSLFPRSVRTTSSVRREWRKMSHLDSMGLTVPTLPIICPFRLYRGYGFPFLASNWVTSCHLPLGFPFLATNCVFHSHASIGCLLGLLYLLTICCGISLFHRVFYHFAVVCCCDLHSTNLSDKNGSRNLPFSASSFDSQCRLRRHAWCLISLFHMAVYHHLTLAGCDLNLANLIAKNGSWNLPFLASNCDIRCYIWLYFRLASGLSPLDRGFYHICNHVSMDCGGSIPPSEFWSWISSPLTLDGLYCPLRSSNGMLECILFVLTCHVVDLPSELLYLFTRKLSAISCMACSWLVFLNLHLVDRYLFVCNLRS